jgi:hypothetical protein
MTLRTPSNAYSHALRTAVFALPLIPPGRSKVFEPLAGARGTPSPWPSPSFPPTQMSADNDRASHPRA